MGEVVERVDEMVRRNIALRAQEKNKHLLQEELRTYEQQRKKDALRSYSELIKEKNRKAVEEAKQKKRRETKKKRKSVTQTQQQAVKQTKVEVQQEHRIKLDEVQIKGIELAIQERAEKILQQNKLNKLNEMLEQQKKKTKLHNLDQRCRKLAKSSIKAPPSSSLGTGLAANILQEFQKKAAQEIEQLDQIIMGLVSKDQQVPRRKTQKCIGKKEKLKDLIGEKNRKIDQSSDGGLWDGKDHPIFVKSTQQLLSLQYIHI